MSTAQRQFRIASAALLAVALSACSGGGGSGHGNSDVTPPPPPPSVTVQGAVQKGPFIVGSTVTVNALGADGSNSTSTIVTQTTDNLGNFVFSEPEGTNVQISSTGFYRNEITGTVSANNVTLQSVGSVTAGQGIYVNLLTHLISGRVLNLVRNGGLDVDAAVDQAESEFLREFSSVVPAAPQHGFSESSIYSDDNTVGSAYLLAVSAIVYRYALDQGAATATSADAALSLFLNELADDFAEDGIIDTSLQALRASIRGVDPDAVMANVAAWIGSDSNYTAVDINEYLDTDLDGSFNTVDVDDDGDGIEDMLDPTPYVPQFVVSDLNVSTDEDTHIVLDLSANSLNSNPITLDVETAPRHGSLTGQYPSVDYSPASNFHGVDYFTYRLVQGASVSSVATVTITVRPVDDSPVISGNPPNAVSAGSLYSFTPVVLNMDGLSLEFSGTNIPSWAVLDSHTGTLSGTPTNMDARLYTDISITVQSPAGAANLGPFDVEVITSPWERLTDMPTFRRSPAVTARNGSIQVVDGMDDFERKTTVEQYDIATASWQALPSNNVGRVAATAHVLGDKLYLIGGSTFDGPLASVEIYSFATGTWSAGSSMTTVRELHASCVYNGLIYAFGGFIDSAHTTSLASVEVYDPSHDTWASRSPMAAPNWGMSCVALNERIYVFGGGENPGGYSVYNPQTDIWETSGTMPVSRRYGFVAAAIGNEIYLFGGYEAGTNKALDDVSMFDPLTTHWTTKSPLPIGTYNIGGTIWDGKVYLFGGFWEHVLGAVRYDPTLDPL